MSLRRPRALIVDKDSAETTSLRAALEADGFDVKWVKDGEQAFNALDDPGPDEGAASGPAVVISDLRAQRVDGMRLLQEAKSRNPEVCVILIADAGTIELATEAMREGAYDFQTRPLNLPKMTAVIRRGDNYYNFSRSSDGQQ